MKKLLKHLKKLIFKPKLEYKIEYSGIPIPEKNDLIQVWSQNQVGGVATFKTPDENPFAHNFTYYDSRKTRGLRNKIGNLEIQIENNEIKKMSLV